MKTTLSRAATGVLALSLAGCTICQSPYDYCTPVIGHNGYPCWCDFSARMNSAFAPPGGPEPIESGPTMARRASSRPDDVAATIRGPQEPPPEPPASDEPADGRADEEPSDRSDADREIFMR